MGDATDAEVIRASLAAPARFGDIFDRHATVLHRYLVRRVGADVGEQLTAETFRIAFERRASFDLERPDARPWLYGIATNLLAHHRRSEGRRLRATARLLAHEPISVDAGDAIARRVDAAARWPAVVDAIEDLPDAERDTLVLVVWEGLSYSAVADALGVPIGTVRSRLNRARARLSRTLGEERET